MFYWSYKGIHVVLTGEEEMALVREVCEKPSDVIGYFVSRETRKEIENLIFRYLEQSLHADPETFNRKYVFRSCYDKEAQEMFPILLDAYGRITKRATIGFYGDTCQLDEATEKLHYIASEKVYTITLFEKQKWPWSKLTASGHISLPSSSIDKLTGTPDNFFIASTNAVIKFHRDFVRISIKEVPNKS